MTLSPQQSLPERLFKAISEDIRGGVYPVGAQMPVEAALCERYGVSRTVLREAVVRLKAEGLIDTQQGRGTFVLLQSAAPPFRFKAPTPDDAQSIIDLAELRLGVEGTAAALAAQRRTDEQLRRLKDCLDRMAQSVKDGSSGTEADLAFHQTIADCTGNAHYRLFMDYLQKFFVSAIDISRSRSARQASVAKKVQAEHRAIYQAIAAQDPDAAEQAIKAHIRAAAARMAAH